MEIFDIRITDPNLFEAELTKRLRKILIEEKQFGIDAPQLEEIISEILKKYNLSVRETNPRFSRGFTTAFTNGFY